MKDIPYSQLKQNQRAYAIMLLRDQQGQTFREIADTFGISLSMASKTYRNTKVKQIHLYIGHITAVLGLEDDSAVKKVFYDAMDCYHNCSCVCAYLEKNYADILTPYRSGEPGMPADVIQNLPPLKTHLNRKTVARIVAMREDGKASFAEIGQKLHLTPEKAQHTYEMFYHKKVYKLVKALQDKADTPAEKIALWETYLGSNGSAKKCYDMLTGLTSPGSAADS